MTLAVPDTAYIAPPLAVASLATKSQFETT
jgi:hypothetical protein